MNIFSAAKSRLSLHGIVGALFLALTVAFAPAAQAQSSLDKILRDKKVRVGWLSAPPTGMKDPNTGELKGYFIDAIRYIFKEIDVEPEFVETTFSTFVAGLQTGQVDLSVASTFITIKRAAVLDYTRPITYVGYSAVIRADNKKFTKVEDLDDPAVKIAVHAGGAAVAYVRRTFPKATVVALDTTNQAAPFIHVASGHSDAGVNDAWLAQRFVTEQPSVKLLNAEPFNVQPIAWSVRKGNTDMLNFINSSIETMLVSGKFEELVGAYGTVGRYRQAIQLVPFASK